MDSRRRDDHGSAARSRAGAARPTFQALLIGIDFYLPNSLPNGGRYESLRGCVHDIERVEAMLRARIDGPIEITTLVAKDTGAGRPAGKKRTWPTYANIKAAFEELIARTQPGDQVYIHYAGHGGRVPTHFEDLKGRGGYDETLVPMDIGEISVRHIRDLDIAYYLDALRTKSQSIVNIVLDSCHSGGATRGVGITPRSVTDALPGFDPTLDTTVRPTDGVAPDDELLAAWQRLAATGTRPRAALATTWLPDSAGYVLLAACSDHEKAYEASMDGAPTGGVMTAAFLDALRRPGADQTWKTLHERVLASVHSRFPFQTPQILGRGDLQVLGVTLQPVVYTVTVGDIDRQKGRVKLRAGRTTGTAKGATFGLYRAGTVDFTQPENYVGAATVDEVRATESWATLHEGASIDAVEPGAPARLEDVGAVELRRAILLVRRDDSPPGIDQDRALAAVEDAIRARGRGFLDLHTSGTPHYQVAVNEAGRYEIRYPTGQPIPNVGPVAVDAPRAAERVVDQLLHIFRVETIRLVEDPYSGLKDALHVELYTPPPDWSPGERIQGGTVIEPADGAYVVEPGAHLFVRVVNNSPGRVNITALVLDDHWAIEAIQPGGPTAGRYTTLDPGEETWFAFQAVLYSGSASAEDTIKIFATVDDSDFWWLLHPPIDHPTTRSLRTRSTAARDALFRLREALDADWNTTRALRPVSRPGSDWTALQFLVRTRSWTPHHGEEQ